MFEDESALVVEGILETFLGIRAENGLAVEPLKVGVVEDVLVDVV